MTPFGLSASDPYYTPTTGSEGSRMITWHWSPKPNPVEHAAPGDMRDTARHLRARVGRSRQGWWWIEVVNTSTGQLVNSDNGHADLAYAFADAEWRVRAARQAWMSGFTQKSLRSRGVA